MLETRMTELFGIEHPIMLAGMNWVTEPTLVSAVCNAGGLGILAIAQYTPEQTRQNIRKIRELTDKPFGINQTLTAPDAKEKIEIAVQEKIPVINYSLGKPWFIDHVHAYGGKVIGTVAIPKHAEKSAQLGCDAIVITGHEAAAHGADATSLVLIPIVANQVDVPIIAAGGFYNGRGLAAALALGADGISMGTRFIATKECLVHSNVKNLCLEATEQDTLYDNVFDGTLGRVLKTKESVAMTRKGFPFFEAIKGALLMKRVLQLSFGKFIGLSIEMMRDEEGSSIWRQARMAACTMKHMKAIKEGNVDQGILFAGQSCGGINDIPNCQELIERIVLEAEETLEATNARKVKMDRK